MARETLSPGQINTVRTDPYDRQGKKIPDGDTRRPAYYQAVAYYGAGDGSRKRKKARGDSRSGAERALRAAVAEAVKAERERAEDTERGEETPRTWDAMVDNHAEFIQSRRAGYSPGTRRVYLGVLNSHMRGRFAGRRLEDIKRGELLKWLDSIAEAHGYGTAKTTKAVATTMLNRALDDYEAIPKNHLANMKTPTPSKAEVAERERERKQAVDEAVAEARRSGELIERDRTMRNSAGSLTADDWERIEAHLTQPAEERKGPGRPRQQDGDVLDLMRFMYAEGTRIGEALGLLWEHVHEDAQPPYIQIENTVVREGKRVLLTPPKTTRSVRRIYVTPSTAALLRRRRAEDSSQGGSDRLNDVGTVFPSTTGTLWEVRAAERALRAVFDAPGVGLPWATSHTFRHTMVTDSSRAGIAVPDISQKVGHAHAATTMGYMSTEAASVTAGATLEEHRRTGRSDSPSAAK